MPQLALIPRLTKALAREFALRRDEAGEISTIYFGGGTPSILPIDLLAELIEDLPTANLKEFTLEANPEDVTIEKAKAWRKLEIDRISMGVQSLNDAELKIIGRRHTATEAIRATERLRDAEFDNYSLDLIYGLPGQSLKSWEKSVDGALALQPKHISAYSLTYEPRTRISAMLKKGQIKEASEDETIAYYKLLCEKLAEKGFRHYEISNFALPGYEAKHNSSYWDSTPYLGLGPSAHSFDGSLRRINPANLKEYIDKIEAGVTAYAIEEETSDNRFNDILITRLRTAQGLDLHKIKDSRREQLLRDANPYLDSGSLVINGSHLSIPEEHWLISDHILTDLIQV